MNAESRQGELPVGPLLAAVGAVLLIVSLFLDWYETASAFTVFEFLDLLLVLLALATIASLAGGMGLLRAAPSPGVSLGVAVFTVFVVVSQILNDPPVVEAVGGGDKEIGIWLALSGAALMVAGAVLGYARISLAVESRPRDRTDRHEAPTVDTRTAGMPPDKPKPEPGRPVASDDPDRP